MRALFLIVVLFIAAPTGATDIYKWVDEDGNTVYSDTPRDDAERIRMEDRSTGFRPPERAEPDLEATSAESADAASTDGGYDSLTIVEPEDEASVRDNQGLVDVTVEVEPGLDPDHRLVVESDREAVSEPTAGTTLQLTEVHRGEHNIVASIVDADGSTLIRSEPVRFYMHQASALLPQGD